MTYFGALQLPGQGNTQELSRLPWSVRSCSRAHENCNPTNATASGIAISSSSNKLCSEAGAQAQPRDDGIGGGGGEYVAVAILTGSQPCVAVAE